MGGEVTKGQEGVVGEGYGVDVLISNRVSANLWRVHILTSLSWPLSLLPSSRVPVGF